MNKEEQIREFLGKLPDDLILSEAGKRMVKKRDKTSLGRAKVMRQCGFCDLFFGSRDMRLHVAKEHPGGKFKNTTWQARPLLGKRCPHCDLVFGVNGMKKHIRLDHPEKINPNLRRIRVKSNPPSRKEEN